MSASKGDANNESELWMVDSGCFCHAVPENYAPDLEVLQPPAGDEFHALSAQHGVPALHHFGYKEVGGFFETEAGGKIFTRLTVQVFDIRRPLFSSMAARRVGVYTYLDENPRLDFGGEAVPCEEHDGLPYVAFHRDWSESTMFPQLVMPLEEDPDVEPEGVEQQEVEATRGS